MTEMRSDGFKCKQCGMCCKGHTILLTEEDVYRWFVEEREDILEWVYPLEFRDEIVGYDFPIDPVTGDDYEDGSPFLKELPDQNVYICEIHNTKPEICATFPLDKKQAEERGCPGYD